MKVRRAIALAVLLIGVVPTLRAADPTAPPPPAPAPAPTASDPALPTSRPAPAAAGAALPMVVAVPPSTGPALAGSRPALPATNAALAASAPATGPATAPTDPNAVSVTLPADKPLPSSPGYFLLQAPASIGAKKFTLSYGLFLPPRYFTAKEKFPLVVALHNRGVSAGALTGEGMAAQWIRQGWDSRDPTTKPTAGSVDLRKDARFIGLAPLCPPGYGLEAPPVAKLISELMTQITQAYRIDEDRLYLTGFSYGATSTWKIAEQMPDRFAAIAPISGRATTQPAQTIETLRPLPVYLGSGSREWAYPFCKIMAEALKDGHHPHFIYRVIPDGSHWCYAIIYTDPAFWEWLFAQRRSANTAKKLSAPAPTTRPAPPTSGHS